jgi:hypothetical protein
MTLVSVLLALIYACGFLISCVLKANVESDG